jgi:hypothetical protein
MIYDDYIYEYTHYPWNNWGVFDEEDDYEEYGEGY